MTVTHPRPLIAVLGATGPQGGSVARALLAVHRHAVRAITRHPGSPAAGALQEAGAELCGADLDDVDSLHAAFAGAHGIYAMTPHFEHRSPERELRQAANIARAARRAGVRHVVWSTQEDARRWVPLHDPRLPTLGGAWKVPCGDAKGAADALFDEQELPLTRLLTAFTWDGLADRGLQPRRAADGTLVFALPMGGAPLAGMAVEDIGPCVRAIFERGTWTVGRTIGLAGEHLTVPEMAAAMSRALGEPVRAEEPTPTAFAAQLGGPDAAGLANLFAFHHLYGARLRAARSVDDTRALHPGALDLAGWLARHARRWAVDARAQAAAGRG